MYAERTNNLDGKDALKQNAEKLAEDQVISIGIGYLSMKYYQRENSKMNGRLIKKQELAL